MNHHSTTIVAACAALSLALVIGCRSAGQPTTPLADDAAIQTIAFGSCARSDRDQDIWASILATNPDVFLFIGDNVYVDIPDDPTGPEDFAVKYEQLAAKPGWRALTATTPVLATWDDHDFGLNDAGKEFPLKEVAKEHFVEFYGFGNDHPIHDRAGIYHAVTVGPPGRRVQFILLDTRTFRDPLTRHPDGRQERPDGTRTGPYTPNPDGKGSLLGKAQWDWLEEQLKQPADVRIVASSIQVVAYEHRWECWGNMPHERRRLYDLIADTNAGGVVFISGDRHLIEISRDAEPGTPYPMWDFTSSGFNWGSYDIAEPNRFREGPLHREPNFGLIRIDWDAPEPALELIGLDGSGASLLQSKVPLSELQP